VVTVRPARPEDAQACVGVLASSPDFFTRETHDEARTGVANSRPGAASGGAGVTRDQAGVARYRAWVAEDAGLVVGFVLAKIRYPATAEVTYAAVRPERRGAGVGTRLVRRALADLAGDGAALVEVKTLDASAGYEPYEATREFWERRGFRQIDCIDPLPGWQPGNPAAIYVAAVRPTTARDFSD
jgi:ribosomal protein S18 acetylase RimI-like enzyme